MIGHGSFDLVFLAELGSSLLHQLQPVVRLAAFQAKFHQHLRQHEKRGADDLSQAVK